jgi:hypothetical protein
MFDSGPDVFCSMILVALRVTPAAAIEYGIKWIFVITEVAIKMGNKRLIR